MKEKELFFHLEAKKGRILMKKIWILIFIPIFLCLVACGNQKEDNPLLSLDLDIKESGFLYVNEDYTPNVVVYAVYEKEKIDVTSLSVFSSVDTKTSGVKTVRVTYLNQSVTYEIEVLAKPLNSFSLVITSEPTKKTYYEGDKLDLSGLKLSAYNNGELEVILDISYEVKIKYYGKEVSDLKDIGQYEIVLSTTYREQVIQTSYFIEVIKNPTTLPKEKLCVDTSNTKTEYQLNEELDTTGVLLYIEDESGNQERILLSSCQLEILYDNQVVTSLDKEGTYTIRISFGNMKAYYGITVAYQEPVKKLVLNWDEAIKSFVVGEAYSSDGLLISYYENDILKTVVSPSSCQIQFYLNGVEHFSFDVRGTYQIVITYQGITESYFVSVV